MLVQALAASALLVLTVPACNRSQSTGEASSTSGSAAAAKTDSKQTYQTKGVIKSFGEGRKTVKIAHEDIPGYMKAMTMPFAVSSPSVLDGLNEGDAVEFSFTEESDARMLIQSIKKP